MRRQGVPGLREIAVTVGRGLDNLGSIHREIQFLICQNCFFLEALIILTHPLSDLILSLRNFLLTTVTKTNQIILRPGNKYSL
jgi:hypothetical protein